MIDRSGWPWKECHGDMTTWMAAVGFLKEELSEGKYNHLINSDSPKPLNNKDGNEGWRTPKCKQ